MDFLVLVFIGAYLFGWIAGIAEISSTPEDGFATGTRVTWLLLVIFTGLLGLVVYVLVGKKRTPAITGGHRVAWKMPDDDYSCQEPGCGFRTASREAGRAHTMATVGAAAGAVEGAAIVPTLVFDANVAATPPAAGATEIPGPTANPESKICPDCAEEIRAAARKCRFCGYLYPEATSTTA